MQKTAVNIHQLSHFPIDLPQNSVVSVLVLPYSNSLLYLITNCDQIGTIVKIELNVDFDGKPDFDVSVVSGYNESNEIYETFASILAETFFKKNGSKMGNLKLFFVSFCFKNVDLKDSNFKKEILKIMEKVGINDK